jgi:hypothetical protein
MMNLNTIGSIALSIAAFGYFSPQVSAQQVPENLAEAMNHAALDRSGDLYSNASIGRQAMQLFGLSYPEQEYLSDAQSIEQVYREGMRQQTGKDNVVRTADLPNPFNSSLLNPDR